MKRGKCNMDHIHVSENHPIVQRKIKKSLDLSVKEGGIASIATGLGASYFGPFALFLGATAAQMSLLHGIAGIFPAITQLYSSHLIEKNSRKRITVASATLMFLTLGLLSILGILYFFDYANMWALLSIVTLFYIAAGLGQPSWFSWMGSLIPAEKRGEYLSKRNKVTGIFGLVTMLSSAIALDYLKKAGIQSGYEGTYMAIGFIILFLLASVFRAISSKLLSKQYEPHLIIRKKDRESFFGFLKNSRKSALGKFGWFNFFLRITMGIAAPFFIIFFIRELNLSYFWYMTIVVSGTLFQLMFISIMGKVSDRFGNIALVKTCSLAIAIIPLLTFLSIYIPSRGFQILYLIIIPQMFSGFGWAGFNLATSNYLYDSTTAEKRGYALTHFNLLTGIGFFIGTILATLLSQVEINVLSISLVAFLISTVLRLGVVIFGRKGLQEVREVSPFSPSYFLHEIHPLRNAMHQVHHVSRVSQKLIHHI
ncbi:MFS transporter [archaeon]|jgi:MFS family permease|nr:MFS transporter [archaeon]